MSSGLARRAACAAAAVAFMFACARGLARNEDKSATPASATSAVAASAPQDIEPTRYLRQLSFDLRGAPPSIEELEAVAHEGHVSDARIDALLHEPAFLAQVRAWHAALLWPNVDGFVHGAPWLLLATDAHHPDVMQYSPYPELIVNGAKHPDAVLVQFFGGHFRGQRVDPCDDHLEYPEPAERGPQPAYSVVGSDGVRRTYPYYDARGTVLPYHDAAHCPNYCSSKTAEQRLVPSVALPMSNYSPMNASGADPSPQELDPSGKHCPATFPVRVLNACSNVPFQTEAETYYGTRQDGFVWRTYYWTVGKRVKVCAYEGQTRAASVTDGLPCTTHKDEIDPSCGCGPDGIFCTPGTLWGDPRPTHDIHEGVDAEPLEIVANVVANDEDYFDVLTTRRSFVTGPLAAYYRSLGGASLTDFAPPAPLAQIPNVSYDDHTWHEYVRGPEHAGVLTTMAYLLRFPTERSRVSQFRSEFMCKPFTPAVASFPGSDDPCTREANLARRCGCKNCHAAIEPMTAWFARWGERTARYLEPSEFPAFDPDCQACAATHSCGGRCLAYAIDAVDAESARAAGTLRGYLYRTPSEQPRIDEGPRGLVETAIASGELESCTVRTAWKNLVGRAMTDDELRDRLPDFEQAFDAHHRSYRDLVRAIVTSPEYRRLE